LLAASSVKFSPKKIKLDARQEGRSAGISLAPLLRCGRDGPVEQCPPITVCSQPRDSGPNPAGALFMVASNIPAFPKGRQTPVWSCCFPEMRSVLWHKHPEKHPEKSPQAANRHKALSTSGQVEEQESGTARQHPTWKVGAAPS